VKIYMSLIFIKYIVPREIVKEVIVPQSFSALL
jgi:hypothetical protein